MALKISIVIPSYNMAKFVEETIQSVINQKYPDFECIVIDGGSTDDTISILKKYQDKIVWISEKDKGQSEAINKGLKRASGDIVTFINADDTYEQGCFQKVADYFEKTPGSKWVYGKCRIINENGREIHKMITWYKGIWQKSYSFNTLLIMDFISQPEAFWRRDLTEEIGLFDVSEHLAMDYDYWLRAGSKYRPGFIDEYLARFRLHRTSKSALGFTAAAKTALGIGRKHAIMQKKGFLIPLQYLNYWLVATTYSLLNSLPFRR
jgi:glycosyltransferase involved in cell wall biosynthesis